MNIDRAWSPKFLIVVITLGWASFTFAVLGPHSLFAQEPVAASPGVITGIVQDENGPLAGASVRVQTTDYQTTTAEDGSFTLEVFKTTAPVTVVAWSKGYFFGWTTAVPGQDPVTITLRRHHRTDNLDYEWDPSANCGQCHTAYVEWQADAHGQSAQNHRFITMYKGTDVEGNRSPSSDYGAGFPKPADLSQPYFGPGFKVDFPDRDGNCASCHTPLASKLPTTNSCGWSGCHSYLTTERSDEIPASVVPVGLTGVAAEGISCDFCHKIGRVRLKDDTGLPDQELTGILSLSIYRPGPEEKLLFGTVDDVARDADSYLPLQEESAFCAGCHYGVFSNTVIYNSFGEWLESPYSDPKTGRTCQDCHMPVVQSNYSLFPEESPTPERGFFVFPSQGGLYRDPNQIHNHRMPGANDEEFLQSAVTMTTTGHIAGDEVQVSISITNDGAGHHVPTGIPLRHLILVVWASDANGQPLPLDDGSILPGWTGNYAGLPGVSYAKILKDALTGEIPSAAHWRLLSIESDNRIPALATDVSQYTFAAPSEGTVIVEAKLLYRRAFQQLMEWKGWNDPDIVMAQQKIVVEAP